MTQKSQRGTNLTQADRERGGRVSASKQERDARGKFAGTKGGNRNRQESNKQESQGEQETAQGSAHGHS